MAGMIELGIEQNEKKNRAGLFPTTIAYQQNFFFEKKIGRKTEKYFFYPGN